MITAERLHEIETAPREAYIAKAEAKELADAYRLAQTGLQVSKDADGAAWLHVAAPSGKKASICLDALAVQRGGIVGAALLEWTDAL